MCKFIEIALVLDQHISTFSDEPVIGTWGDPPAYTKEASKVGG